MQSAAIIVAAGRGERAGGLKQYRPLAGEPVLRRVLRLFVAHPGIDAVQPVIHPADEAEFRATAAGIDCLPPVPGGATRQASVRAGLEALSRENPTLVLVHDAARPLASRALLDRALAAARESGAAIPVLLVNDTIKRVNAAGRVIETVAREELRAVQTPQAFAFAPLLDAHRRAAQEGRNDFTDDAALMEWAGVSVATFPGETGNLKLTTPDDFARAAAMDAFALGDVRIGTGLDIHAFKPGDHIMLGGVKIPHGKGLIGHSDADVLLHALTDAVLGAIAEGDIGHHFPPSDARWRGAPSDQFLAHAVARVKQRGGRIVHLDATVVCEAPKIGPHRDAIRVSIARIAGIKIGQVSVKATTTAGLGFIGRGEGIAAHASATIRLPWSTE